MNKSSKNGAIDYCIVGFWDLKNDYTGRCKNLYSTKVPEGGNDYGFTKIIKLSAAMYKKI